MNYTFLESPRTELSSTHEQTAEQIIFSAKLYAEIIPPTKFEKVEKVSEELSFLSNKFSSDNRQSLKSFRELPHE